MRAFYCFAIALAVVVTIGNVIMGDWADAALHFGLAAVNALHLEEECRRHI